MNDMNECTYELPMKLWNLEDNKIKSLDFKNIEWWNIFYIGRIKFKNSFKCENVYFRFLFLFSPFYIIKYNWYIGIKIKVNSFYPWWIFSRIFVIYTLLREHWNIKVLNFYNESNREWKKVLAIRANKS